MLLNPAIFPGPIQGRALPAPIGRVLARRAELGLTTTALGRVSQAGLYGMALAPSGSSVPTRPRANRKSPRRSRAKRADPSARDDSVYSVYTEYGIELKTWFAENTSGRITYLVSAWPWHCERRIIERDGLVSFQVTIHHEDR